MEQVLYFRNVGKLATRPIVLNPARIELSNLVCINEILQYILHVPSKNPVGLSRARTCIYFEINIDFPPILKVKLVNPFMHNVVKWPNIL